MNERLVSTEESVLFAVAGARRDTFKWGIGAGRARPAVPYRHGNSSAYLANL